MNWHRFIRSPPGECIGPKRAGRVLLDCAAHGQYETKGTLAEWRASVAALTAGHTIPMLAISTALAGPLFCEMVRAMAAH